MTTGGGVTVAKNLTITTQGQSSAPIRTDRGGGNVTVTGGSYTSNGLGSPAIYSTADIVVNNATLTSNLSEGVCIEGQNSVTLSNCTLTANNTKTNGNAQFLDAIILYQSQSGDAADGTSTFSMTGGSLVNKSGHLFHVTNTTAIINLEGVTINDTGDGVLLSVCDDGWSGASNVATLNADSQTMTGNILVGSDSTLTLNLTDSSTFTGNISGSISNASGTSVSTSVGTVNVTLDSTSKWYLTGDTYVTSFDGTASNVITGNYTLYVNNVALDGTTKEESSSSSTALNITNSTDSTLVTGSELNDTIQNSGDKVTIDGAAGNDSIVSSGANVSINGGTGNDSLYGGAGKDTIYAASGNDVIYGGAGNDYLHGSSGADSLFGGAGNDKLYGGTGNDYINGNAGNDSINGGTGNDTLAGATGNDTLWGGTGNDFINGYSGADYLLGEDGNDTLAGSAGNDTLLGGSGKDSLSGGSGNDILSGGASNDTLFGGAGNDSLSGGKAHDKIYGDAGNDTLWGGSGSDSLTGGDGSDVFVYISGEVGTDTILDYESDDMLQILNSDGSSGGTYSASSFSDSKLTLTIDGGGTVVLSGVSSGDEININGTTHTIKNSKLA